MTTPNDADRNERLPAENPAPAADDAEVERVKRRLAELRAQGVFADGHDPDGRPQTIARIPGATARLIERRG